MQKGAFWLQTALETGVGARGPYLPAEPCCAPNQGAEIMSDTSEKSSHGSLA
jgi:hypothetical protein